MQTLEQQNAAAENRNTHKYHAEFVRNADNVAAIEVVGVFSVSDNDGHRIYLGNLDVNDSGYVGELVFNLDIESLSEGGKSGSIHIPLNVLREIAEYRISQKAGA